MYFLNLKYIAQNIFFNVFLYLHLLYIYKYIVISLAVGTNLSHFWFTVQQVTIMDQNTTNSTEGPCGLSEMPARPFFICIYTGIFLASLVLNSITVYVYFCKATNQSSITIYMKNLAIADLFVCLCLILRIAKYANKSMEIQRIYCNFGAPASYLNMYTSILFMGYLAANRYGGSSFSGHLFYLIFNEIVTA